ncbi:hypothetical protein [Halalkalibacter alkalisediminis]|uniref:Uncharacterized protein n=1 Tax=Halalkalibacter alkalisediminis TaxID=935616 RepID=A0ABV6ND51_9BACI|nr:hypothetical protein [Halalkalibacter alkalisediminis]
MESIVKHMTKDFEEKLKRTLNDNEVEFIRWMVSNSNYDCRPLPLEHLKQA